MKENKNNEYNIIGEVAPKDMPAIKAFIKITGDQSILRSVHCSKESIQEMREELQKGYVQKN